MLILFLFNNYWQKAHDFSHGMNECQYDIKKLIKI